MKTNLILIIILIILYLSQNTNISSLKCEIGSFLQKFDLKPVDLNSNNIDGPCKSVFQKYKSCIDNSSLKTNLDSVKNYEDILDSSFKKISNLIFDTTKITIIVKKLEAVLLNPNVSQRFKDQCKASTIILKNVFTNSTSQTQINNLRKKIIEK